MYFPVYALLTLFEKEIPTNIYLTKTYFNISFLIA